MGVKSTDLDLSDLKNVSGSQFDIPVQDNYLPILLNPIANGHFTERTYGEGFSFTVGMSSLLAADFGNILGDDFTLQDFSMHHFWTAYEFSFLILLFV